MILKLEILEQIKAGEVTLAVRRWRRPTVRAGGTLRTAAGVVAIDAVEPCTLGDLTEADAKAAGHASLADLRRALAEYPEGELYRIALHWAGVDPRIALRAERLEGDADREALREALARLDARSPRGPWTGLVLQLIGERPAVRAAELAARVGWEVLVFKQHVRKLKGLGLTESLEVGYRLSPRGADALAALRAQGCN